MSSARQNEMPPAARMYRPLGLNALTPLIPDVARAISRPVASSSTRTLVSLWTVRYFESGEKAPGGREGSRGPAKRSQVAIYGE